MPQQQRVTSSSWLRRERERRETLQGRLARDLGVSQQSLSGYESGRWRVPDDVAARLARLWGLRESEVRRELGLYVPEDLAQARPVAAEQEWPDNAIRLPKGVKWSDLKPEDQRTVEELLDVYMKRVMKDVER